LEEASFTSTGSNEIRQVCLIQVSRIKRITVLADEWYRRTTWTKDDQADFEARLARARKQNRAQYLLIQASYLMEAANRKLTSAALELLNRMLAEYPSDVQVAQAHTQRAECHIQLGEVDKAIEAFRSALARSVNSVMSAPTRGSTLGGS